MSREAEHGEVWKAALDMARQVVIVSRDDVTGRRDSATVAAIISTIRGLPTVLLDHRDGFSKPCAINCDELTSIRKARLDRRIGRLSDTKIGSLDDALRFALQLR